MIVTEDNNYSNYRFVAKKSGIGIAFSGGGVTGASHLGIMEAFSEKGIKPTVFTGTSSGSIVATLLALGYSPSKAFQLFSNLNGEDILDIAISHIIKGLFTKEKISGIFKGDKLEKKLCTAFNFKTIDEITTNNIGIVAADVLTGKQIIFSNKIPYSAAEIRDDNYKWVVDEIKLSFISRASSSLPGVFLPKKYKNYLLVDGGVVNNLPSDIAKALGAEKVISIDLGYAGERSNAGNIDGIYDILNNSIAIALESIVDRNRDNYGIYLNPKIYNIGVLQIDRLEEAYDRGYAYGKGVADEVLNRLEKL